jgi:outer membrane receptor for ferrienterochelin and colicins
MFGKLSIVLLYTFISVFCFSQEIKFIDEKSLKPVPDIYVKVFSKSKNIELITNEKGTISITGFSKQDLPLQLHVSHYAFQSFMKVLEKLEDKKLYVNTSENLTTFEEVAVTAQYKKQAANDAVHQVKIINEEKIKSMGAQNLRDVFTNELNIRVSQDFALGSSMSLQGVSGQNVKILVDGVPLTGRLNGNIDISQINLNNVERIEIIEGPLSVSYGTDALAGTINIITKKEVQDNYSLSSSNYYESIGNFNNSINLGWANKKNNISLTLSRNYFDGWSQEDNPFYYNFDPVADSSRFQDWKPKEQRFGTFNYRRFLGDVTLDLTSDLFWEEVVNKGAPRAPYFQTAFDDYYRTTRFNNSATLNGEISEDKNLNIILAYNHFQRRKNTFFRDLTTIEDQLATSPGAQDTSTFNNIMSRGTFSSSKTNTWINYEVGYDINYEIGFGPRILQERQSIGDYALFSSAEIQPFERFTLRPGLRAIHNTSYNAPLVPSLNLRYKVIEDKAKRQELTLRSSYARGFRAPDLKELYFFFVDINHNIQGNPDLVAEHSHNFNLASTFTKRKKNLRTKLTLSGFYNSIENMIGLAQAESTLFTYFNINEFKTTGGNILAEWAFYNFNIQTGGSYIGRYNQFNDDPETPTQDPFLFSPEGQLNIAYKFEKIGLKVSSFYKYTGQMPLVRLNQDDQPSTSFIDAFHTFDLSITKDFWNNKIQLTAGAKNLFNVTNINGFAPGGAHSGGGNTMAIAMGRTYFLSLNIYLSKNKKK